MSGPTIRGEYVFERLPFSTNYVQELPSLPECLGASKYATITS